jgi:hypothetical protein
VITFGRNGRSQSPECALGAGFGETRKGIAAITPEIAAGAAADFALGHVAADGVLGTVGMQRDLWPVERHQQLGFVGMKPGEQPIEGGKAGAALEDAVETSAQGGSALRRRIAAVGFEVAIEPPNLPRRKPGSAPARAAARRAGGR